MKLQGSFFNLYRSLCEFMATNVILNKIIRKGVDDVMAMKKEDLARMIYRLSDTDVLLAADIVRRLIPGIDDEHIPYDDEPLTEEDIEEIQAAAGEIREGKGIKLKDVEDELRG